MVRWFWRLYWPLAGAAAAAIFIGPLAGPQLEQRYFPIRGAQSVHVVERTGPSIDADGRHRGGRICWDWTFVKLRDTWSPNIDAFLEINGEPGGVAAPYDRDSGRPWGIQAYAVAPRPEPYTLTYCVDLAPYVAVTDRVRITQTADYPGWRGRWRLSVPFPDVADPPDPKAVHGPH